MVEQYTVNSGSATAILNAALYFAEKMGWSVFPAPPGEKKSHKSAKYSGGVNWGATRDPEQVRRDFEKWPDANIGIPTGAANGIFVLDIDAKNGKDGFAALAALEALHGKLPDTAQAESPSGSRHYYFQHPGFNVSTSTSQLGDGIDIRGDGGMCIAPPSVKPGAGAYKWTRSVAMVPAPDWLLDLVKADAASERTTRSAPKGQASLPDARRAFDFLAMVDPPLSDDESRIAITAAVDEFGTVEAYSLAARLFGGLNAAGLSRVNSFEPKPDGIGINSLRKLLQDRSGPTIATDITGKFDAAIAATAPLPAMPVPKVVTFADRRINAASFAGHPVPEREWLVEGLIPASQVTLVAGDGGTGKSQLITQLATAVATGTLWLGQLVKPGAVEFITAEDSAEELHRRLHIIAREIPSQSLDKLARLHVSSLADESALLAIETARDVLEETPLYKEVATIVEASRPRLLVLDTLADIFGGNEVVRVQARLFISMLRKIAIAHNCAVVVLAHPSRSGMTEKSGASGSTGWKNSVRSQLYLDWVQDEDGPVPDARVLSVVKANYAKTGHEIRLRWRRGIFVTDMPEGLAQTDPLAKVEKAKALFLELLDKYTEQNRYVCGSQQANNFAPKMFAADALKQGVTRKEMRAAMEWLFDAGAIENAPYGPPSRIVHRLQRTHRPVDLAPPLAPDNR